MLTPSVFKNWLLDVLSWLAKWLLTWSLYFESVLVLWRYILAHFDVHTVIFMLFFLQTTRSTLRSIMQSLTILSRLNSCWSQLIWSLGCIFTNRDILCLSHQVSFSMELLLLLWLDPVLLKIIDDLNSIMIVKELEERYQSINAKDYWDYAKGDCNENDNWIGVEAFAFIIIL